MTTTFIRTGADNMPDATESRENYLEIIYMLSSRGDVRAADIVRESGFSKPSVSIAMKHLKSQGYVVIDEKRHISLTEEGRKIAVEVYKKHRYITKFLFDSLGVSERVAEEDACRIEHIVSDELYEAIMRYVRSSEGYDDFIQKIE